MHGTLRLSLQVQCHAIAEKKSRDKTQHGVESGPGKNNILADSAPDDGARTEP